MKSFNSDIHQKYVVEVNWIDRWQIYQRLKELEIPCCCETNQPLQVEIAHPTAAMQLWRGAMRFCGIDLKREHSLMEHFKY